jgi:hypothetical protein
MHAVKDGIMVSWEEFVDKSAGLATPQSLNLTALLLPHLPWNLIVDLEAFRYRYEREHGPTNLLEVYISQYPIDYQIQCYEENPTMFWNRHPPYVREFWLQEAQTATKEGRLDEVPSYVIQAYLGRLKGNRQFRRE